ncbi:MAG: hypothetical protein Q9223_005434 [Gallowayella weberi]
MNGLSPSDNYHRPQPRSQRSSSISNDRASLSVVSLACPPPVWPDPAYIAPSSASQIVTGDQEISLEDEENYEATNSRVTNTLVAPSALLLINAFLDQLLYSFLLSSRSTSIAALRPAVTEVLKPRLAKDAIASADEELQEFLGGGDDDELSAFHDRLEPRAAWDLNKIWRRTRLRCMVYTRLGDLEEEDEEMWVERENTTHEADGQHRLSRDLGVVSPAAAIFLTSILEYIGEQVLLVSAEAAYTRVELRRRQDKIPTTNSAGTQRPSVDVVDIEKLAVNTTFGRLWRSWKKRVRSPSITKQRPSSHEYFLGPANALSVGDSQRQGPRLGEEQDRHLTYDTLSRSAAANDSRTVGDAAAIPLPTTTHDAREIEGVESPWQSRELDSTDRPRSMQLSSDSFQAADQNDDIRNRQGRHVLLQRNRSSSLPQLEYRQHPDHQGSLYSISKEAALFAGSQNHTPGTSRYALDSSGITTMYDGAIGREGSPVGSDRNPSIDTPRRPYETSEIEAQNLDEGLDSLARASNESLPFKTGTGPITNDSNQTPFGELPKRSNIMDKFGVRTDQHLPSRVENSLDSPSMQGHPTENVSLDNRETSISGSKPLQTAEIWKSAAGLPDGKASLSKYGRDEAISSSPTSTANHDRSNRTSFAPTGLSTQYESEALSQPESAGYSGSVAAASPYFPQAKPSVKLSDIRKQLPPVSTGVERASVQRVSSSPGGALESPVGRTSTSSSRELRCIPTSGSNTSQTAIKSKVLGARGSSDISRQYAVSRRSSEASANLATPLVRTPEVDETQRSFEQLIKSDETIQYTLTPQSVRETDSLDSPRFSHNRTGTADLADFIRTSGPPPAPADMGRPSTSRSIVSLKGLNGLRSNPIPPSRSAAVQSMAPSLEKPNVQSQRPGPTTARSAQGRPRDAQLDTETTRDFADFIRSTGPEAVSRPNMNDNTTAPASIQPRPSKGMTPDQRSTSVTSTGKKITKPNPGLSKSPPSVMQQPSPKRSVSKLQARQARYEPTHNEDLLDFLKQGPMDDRAMEKRPVPGPVASIVPQNPRVPTNPRERNSDNTRSSVGSTQDSTLANRSIRSTNSRTGLLDGSRGSHGGSPPMSQRPSRFDEAPQAIRQQRRVKDPYAIDTDSEDDDRPGTPKPQRQEESLIDFLNSTPPPSESNPRIPSAFDDIPNPTIRNANSNNGNTDRYNKRTSRTATAPTPGIRSAIESPTSNPQQQQARRGRTVNPAPSGHPPQLPPLNSRDISPHIMATYTTAQPPTSALPPNGTASSTLTSTTTTTSSTPLERPQRKVKAVGIARSERDDSSRGMNDLADFLKNSEPPTQVPREMMGQKDNMDDKEVDEGKSIWGRIKKRRGR